MKVAGIVIQPLTMPIVVYRSAVASSISKSGMRVSTSRTMAVISARAMWEPRQRWAPTPKATWRFGDRSRTISSGRSKTDSSWFADAQDSSSAVPRLELGAGDLGRGGDRPGQRLRRREVAEELLDRRREQVGLVDQPLAVVGVLVQVVERGGRRGRGRVEARPP